MAGASSRRPGRLVLISGRASGAGAGAADPVRAFLPGVRAGADLGARPGGSAWGVLASWAGLIRATGAGADLLYIRCIWACLFSAAWAALLGVVELLRRGPVVLSRCAALRVVGLPGAAGRWRSFHGSGLISGPGPVVSSCPARAELWQGLRADLGRAGSAGRSWAGLVASGPAIRGRGRRFRAGPLGAGFAGGAGAHFTPLANFPGPILILPCRFSGRLLLRFSNFLGAYTPRAHFRIFLHFRNIPPFFAFFLRYSQK